MKLLITLFTLTAFSFISFGQQSSQAVLDNLSKKMKSHTSFYIEFSASTENKSTGTSTSDTGKGWVKNNKYFASFGDNTIISNAAKTWTIVKEEKSVYESDAEEDDDIINPRKLMTIWEDGFKNKYGKETTLSGETVHQIFLYPKDAGSVEYHTIILYISKAKNELKKVTIRSKDGTVLTYILKKYDANPEISDSKFVFDAKKYPGYTVIKD